MFGCTRNCYENIPKPSAMLFKMNNNGADPISQGARQTSLDSLSDPIEEALTSVLPPVDIWILGPFLPNCVFKTPTGYFST
jgi:hypothetical protein